MSQAVFQTKLEYFNNDASKNNTYRAPVLSRLRCYRPTCGANGEYIHNKVNPTRVSKKFNIMFEIANWIKSKNIFLHAFESIAVADEEDYICPESIDNFLDNLDNIYELVNVGFIENAQLALSRSKTFNSHELSSLVVVGRMLAKLLKLVHKETRDILYELHKVPDLKELVSEKCNLHNTKNYNLRCKVKRVTEDLYVMSQNFK